MTRTISRGTRLAAPFVVAALAACSPTPPADGPVPAPAPAPAPRGSGATAGDITAADLRLRVGALAHDSLQGRDTGSPGLRKAAEYIAAEMRRLGLRPAGDNGTFLDQVDLEAASTRVTATHNGTSLGMGDVVLLSGLGGVPGNPRPSGEGTVVYGGWQADTVSPSRDLSPEQLRGSVLVLRYGQAPGTSGVRQRFGLESLVAPNAAPAAVLIVSEGPVEEFWEYASGVARSGNVARRGAQQDHAGGGGGPPVFLVSPAAAERMLGRPVAGWHGPAAGLGTFRYSLQESRAGVEAFNVVAVLPGSDPRRAGQYVAIGAHYDHVGVGAAADGDSIYNGADDDASGTAGVIEIAERLASLPQGQRPARSILFVWHTAEEKGLLGSEQFTEEPTVPRDSIVAQLNIDMIGRNSADSLFLVGSRRISTQLGDLVEAVNGRQPRPFRFDYSFDAPNHPERIYCRSDHYNYARYGIPVTFFTTGLHEDYHKPSDEPEKIDYDKLARVSRLIGDIAAEVASLPARLTADKPVPPLGTPCS